LLYGLGVDLCKVSPIRRSVSKFGKAWLDEVFSNAEQANMLLQGDLSVSAAVGFAIKEACAKALGTGLANGVHWHDFEIRRNNIDWDIRLSSRAREHAMGHTPVKLACGCRTLLSTDRQWTIAMATLYDDSTALADFPFWNAVMNSMPKLIEWYHF